jgi:hypothetical protein
MARSIPLLALAAALAACRTAAVLPEDLTERLAACPEGSPARLHLDPGGALALVLPIQPVELPPAARTGVESAAPRGTTTFVGREWGPRGQGYRVDKHYDVEGVEHTRSVLVDNQGQVLERVHSVPIAEVPEAVITTAARFGHAIERVEIVAGTAHVEHWRCLVTDRSGRHFVVRTGLDGTLLDRHRRLHTELDG